jgi:tetratricopeptide (TPR) repeat protein
VAFFLGVLALAATVTLAQPTAGAEAKAQAREHYRRATVAYNLGNYDEAAAQYEASYRLVQDSALLYNIGQAYRLAGRQEKALAAYKGFLRTAAPDDPHRTAVEARVTELERALRPPEPPPPPPAAIPPPVASTPAPTPPGDVPVVTEEAPGFRTTAGAQLAWGGRASRDENAFSFRGFARLADPNDRVYELGYLRRPIYPMNPAYQYSAVYGIFRSRRHWLAEAGALGAEGEWHLGGAYVNETFDAGLRIERAAPEHLCNSGDGSLVYVVPETHVKVPVSSRLRVLALGSYRGKLVTRSCQFHPSLLTLELSAELALREQWTFSGGLGHYGLFDLGPGRPDQPWPSDAKAAEQISVGARYLVGKVAIVFHYRFITYAGGTHELGAGVEFRSSPEAP